LILVADTLRISGRNMIVYAFINQPEVMKTEIAKFEGAARQIPALLASLRALMTTEMEKAAFERVERNLNAWVSMTAKVNAMSVAGNPAEAAVYSQKNTRVYAQAMDNNERDMVEAAAKLEH
jgi:hypothetical protein